MKHIKKSFIYITTDQNLASVINWPRTTIALLAAVFYTCLIYICLQLVTYFIFSVQVWSGTWQKDIIAHLALAMFLYSITKSWRLWATACTLLISVLQISNALKLVVLGSPIMPDDFFSINNMLHLFTDWRLPAIITAIFLPLLTVILAIAWKQKTTWIILFFTVTCSLVMWTRAPELTAYMDKNYGDWIWNQPGNYRDRGLVRHLLHESLRNMARGKVELSSQQVHKALATLAPDTNKLKTSATLTRKPNVYMILLESFWDPMLLTEAGIHPDPVDPRFRELWQQTDLSTASAPVFGGYTANSEFEVLCGFPVTSNAVFFEGWLRNDAPCLPRYLKKNGYTSIAAHPNYAAFWNRVNSYKRIGFDQYWSKNDFELDDMNREFLSDSSLYRQVLNKLQQQHTSNESKLMYIVTFFGHLDYPLSESRPEKIEVDTDNKMLKAYVNQIYYKSRELMDFLETLQIEDPEAMVVIFGDHLPFLGANNDGFVQQGLFTENKAEFNAQMFKSYVTTPLIVIDGKNGPQKAGNLPMYQLPAYILELLGDRNKSFLHISANENLKSIRPLAGLSLYLPEQGEPLLCKQQTNNEDERCSTILKNTEMMTTLRDDLFTASQYSLQKDTK